MAVQQALSQDSDTLVDFILPQYEDSRILRAIHSITRHPQSRYFRLIVQDAGKNSALHAQIAQALRPFDLHIRERDSGIFDAINKGLTQAQAPWVGWLGADDYLAPDFSIEPLLRAAVESVFVAYVTVFFDDQTGLATRVYRPVPFRWLRRMGCHLPHFSTFVRRCALRGRAFEISERNYADQVFFYDLENNCYGEVTSLVSTYMAEGGASNQSTVGILRTNKQVMRSFNGRKSKISALAYVVIKLIYKMTQRLEALVRRPKQDANWTPHG